MHVQDEICIKPRAFCADSADAFKFAVVYVPHREAVLKEARNRHLVFVLSAISNKGVTVHQ